MDFQAFLEHIEPLKTVSLPGELAHELMMPPERRGLMQKIDWEQVKPRQAAVMMLFYPKNDLTHLVLIQRNVYQGVHSAQIAFPGGKVEPTDANLAETALRETHEEIGVVSDSINVVRPFSQVYIPPSNFMVAPFLGLSYEPLAFFPDPAEVSGIIELPLQELLSDASPVVQNMDTSYSQSIDVPSFHLQGHFVWGATAMMLSELRETLKKLL